MLLEGIIPVLLEAIVWGFLACLIFTWALSLLDISRRDDLSPRSKAGRAARVILLPFFGSQLYLLDRPRPAHRPFGGRSDGDAAPATLHRKGGMS